MNPSETELATVINHVVEQAATAVSGWNESETRDHLIRPVLSALGYVSRDEVRSEYRLAASGQFVDYLLLAGDTKVVVEAKAFGGELTPKDAAQLVGYCAQEGIRWALLTNGAEWRVFDIAAPGNWQAKSIAALRLIDEFRTGNISNAINRLSLFRRSSISLTDSALVAWAFEVRVRRAVSELLSKATSPVLLELHRQLQKQELNVELDDLIQIVQLREESKGPDVPQGPEPPEPGAHSFYIFPAGDEGGYKASEYFEKLLKAGFWAVRAGSAYRGRIAPGDRCAFYASKVGVLATALVTAPANRNISEVSWPGPGPSPNSSELYVVPISDVRWLDPPIKLDLACRQRLQAFAGKDLTRPWSWFIQSTSKVSQSDFEVITGQA